MIVSNKEFSAPGLASEGIVELLNSECGAVHGTSLLSRGAAHVMAFHGQPLESASGQRLVSEATFVLYSYPCSASLALWARDEIRLWIRLWLNCGYQSAEK